MEEQKQEKVLEATIEHRWLDLTSLFSQKAVGKNLIVEDVFWTHTQMVVRCEFNFLKFENPMEGNKFVPGVNKFKGADLVIDKVAYFAGLPENKDKKFTVHH